MEHHVINFSRFRLSSHCLKIEPGRCRIPRETRTCKCNNTNIKNEAPLTEHLRRGYNIQYKSLKHLFAYMEPLNDVTRRKQNKLLKCCYLYYKVNEQLDTEMFGQTLDFCQ